ncbi:MAG TPA: SDR family oxidoreductase [Candidatus Paceibacterota bacterium]|nr:SDR family oxidoreductase [Candidatus Paceibacterota bacterium]
MAGIMDLGLKDKVAVVMAASRGLGKATAAALAAEGCHLAIASREAGRIQTAAEDLRQLYPVQVLTGTVDVTQPDSIDAFARAVEQRYGAVDILIHNSGGPVPGTFDVLSVEQFQQAVDLLLMNVVRATKAFLPLIRQRKAGGCILTITSISVREVIPNLMLSNSVRAAVTGWSKTLARELGPEKIRVNCVAPGTIHTERIEELVAAGARQSGRDPTEVRLNLQSRIPLGRFGRPEEFGAAMAFLASDRASFISGVTLVVDGAQMCTVT